MDAVASLIDAIMEKNALSIDSIISIQFTQTPDLVQINAAAALRNARPHFNTIPLFTSQEAVIKGMPERIVRVLLMSTGTGPGKAVYLGKAQRLRPDLIG